MLEISASNEAVPAYLAEPTGDVKGGIIVIHEIWALNDHTKSIADRFAAEGYLALAPNLLTVLDITEHAAQLQADLFNPEKRNEAQPKIRAMMAPIQEPGFAEKTITNVKACFDFLYDKPETKQRVAVNGYCFGGSYSYSLAINEPRLKAAIPFYGHVSTDVDELKKITCPLRAF
jgi:carboxymethylenebutenolidase